MIQVDAVREKLPPDLEQLQTDARAEGYRFVDRLANDWASGANMFLHDGEALFAARVDGVLAGIGGMTLDPALSGAIRMRRFYIRPRYRRLGLGRRLVRALLALPRQCGALVTVNAGTALAPAFWEALGFHRDDRNGHTHILTSTGARLDVDGSTLVIRSETPDQTDVLAFLRQADERSASLYPQESRHGLSLATLLASAVRFFVARQEGRALGCGGYILLPDGTAEMKRLFVDPGARARGVGSRLIQAIETAAEQEGVGTLLLETGIKSVEALNLYKRHGFTECGPFASYQPDSLSVFMVKEISAHTATSAE